MKFTRREVDNSTEKNIIIATIIDDEFIKQIQEYYKHEYFKIPYAREIIKWCFDYEHEYEKAPVMDIQKIFDAKKGTLDSKKIELIETFLYDLSNSYEENPNINTEYILDQALKYFARRSFEILGENLKELCRNEDVKECEKLISDHVHVEKLQEIGIEPFQSESVDKVMTVIDKNKLFKPRGFVGNLIGHFEREWLVGIMGPAKRGKTSWLQEFAIQCIEKRLKTLFISLEMSEEKTNLKFYRRITGMSEKTSVFRYPVFDCVGNQTGTCNKKQRENKTAIMDEDGQTLSNFDPNDYEPCYYCRDNDPHEYDPGVWIEKIERPKLTAPKIKRRLEKFNKTFGKGTSIVMRYPTFSATLATIENDIKRLEITKDFIPDVILIDYADIIAPIDRRLNEREEINSVWKDLKKMATDRKCLVITASQTNRPSFKKYVVDPTDMSEDIRKMAHADLIIGLNQTPEEKHYGVMRLNLLAHRHHSFDSKKQAIVLQQMEMGQTCIDSEVMTYTMLVLPNFKDTRFEKN